MGTGAALSVGAGGCSVAGGCSGAGVSSAAGAGVASSFGAGAGSSFGAAGAGSAAGGAVLPVIAAKPRGCFGVSSLGSLLWIGVPAPDQKSLLQTWDLDADDGVPAPDQASPLWIRCLDSGRTVPAAGRLCWEGGNQVTEPGQGLGDFYRLVLALVTSLQTNLPAQAGAARNSHPGPAHSAACPYPLLWDCNTWSCPPATSQAHTGLSRPGPGHLSLGTELLSPPPKLLVNPALLPQPTCPPWPMSTIPTTTPDRSIPAWFLHHGPFQPSTQPPWAQQVPMSQPCTPTTLKKVDHRPTLCSPASALHVPSLVHGVWSPQASCPATPKQIHPKAPWWPRKALLGCRI